MPPVEVQMSIIVSYCCHIFIFVNILLGAIHNFTDKMEYVELFKVGLHFAVPSHLCRLELQSLT